MKTELEKNILIELKKSRYLFKDEIDMFLEYINNLNITEKVYERIKGTIKTKTSREELQDIVNDILDEDNEEIIYVKRKCPICGEKELVEIVYGYPGRELFEASEKGLVMLGGCCIEDDGPYSIENFYCHNCKKRINLERENMKVDRLFRYIEKDAWGMECHEDILIRDSREDNVILNSDTDLPLVFSIDYEDILKIKNIINENEYLFRIRNVQGPDWILDGSIHELYFWNKDIVNKIETNNLEKWENNSCKYRNTKYLLKIINEISKILEKYEINMI